MTIRVGAQIQPQHASYRQMRDAWLRVEEMEADTLFNWDHFFPLYGDSQRFSQVLIHVRSLEDEAILEGSKAEGARGRRSRDAPPRGCGGLWGFYPVHKALAQQTQGNRRCAT